MVLRAAARGLILHERAPAHPSRDSAPAGANIVVQFYRDLHAVAGGGVSHHGAGDSKLLFVHAGNARASSQLWHFLLAAVGGYSVFRRPTGRAAEITALLYGAAMGLTFDEFGMWLHLGGSYWQRASVDAVIVVAALFGLVAFATSLRRFELRHFWAFLVLAVALIGFVAVLFVARVKIGDVIGPKLRELESASSP